MHVCTHTAAHTHKHKHTHDTTFSHGIRTFWTYQSTCLATAPHRSKLLTSLGLCLPYIAHASFNSRISLLEASSPCNPIGAKMLPVLDFPFVTLYLSAALQATLASLFRLSVGIVQPCSGNLQGPHLDCLNCSFPWWASTNFTCFPWTLKHLAVQTL